MPVRLVSVLMRREVAACCLPSVSDVTVRTFGVWVVTIDVIVWGYPPRRPRHPQTTGRAVGSSCSPANAYRVWLYGVFRTVSYHLCLPRDPSTTHSALASTTGSRFGRGRTARARPASRAPVLLVRSDDFNLPASARLQRDEASTGSVGAPFRDENSGRSPYRPGRVSSQVRRPAIQQSNSAC